MTDSLRSAYERDGFAVAESVLDGGTVQQLVAALAEVERAKAPTPRILYTHESPPETLPRLSTVLTQWRNAWRGFPPALGREVLSRIRCTAQRLAEYTPVPFQDVVTRKDPGQGVFAWHQDVSYWPVDREDGIVAWLALDPVDAANGGVELSAGSHCEPAGPSVDLHTGLPQPGSRGVFVPPTRGEVPRLQPGDLLCFHARAWHRSGVNVSGALRRAWAVSFLHPETRWRFDRAPRHGLTKFVSDGEEVGPWSTQHYPHAHD